MRIYIVCLLLVLTFSPTFAGKGFSSSGEKAAINDSTADELIVNTEEKILSGLSEEESEWYERFKEGAMFFDGWNEISGNILEIFSADKAAENELFVRMLGIKIGSEWCRHNDIRKIDTQMLKHWGDRIRDAVAMGPEITEKILREIDLEVDRLLEMSDRKALFSPQS